MDTSPRIVVVDGDPDAAAGTAKRLDRRCAPAVAETDPDAVLRGDRSELACVVCEYDLGDRTGFDLLSALRERSAAPVVFYAGTGDESVAARAVSADVAAYVPKDAPDAESRLVAAVEAALADGGGGGPRGHRDGP